MTTFHPPAMKHQPKRWEISGSLLHCVTDLVVERQPFFVWADDSAL